MSAWTELVRRSVTDVGGYRPGVSGDEVRARFGLEEVVRLNWNENLFGPLPGVLDEVAASLDAVWRYPEDSYRDFREAVARWTGAAPDQVIPGHGIQALTLALVATFVDRGDVVVIPTPTYGLYAQACRVAGAHVHRVPSDSSLAIDLDAVAETARERRAKLAWICDPNNPTGLRLDPSAWSAFLEALSEGCVVVVDEAYGDYVEPDARIDRLRELSRGAPVILLRTFSKIFGLAGLRLGYALVGESLAPYVNAVQEPFNVNRAALAAGLASLRRVDQLTARREQNRAARERLVGALRAADIRTLSSDANFVLLETGVDDQRVCDALARDGLLVRPGSELGLPGYVRVTTGDESLMEQVGARIADVVTRERSTVPPPSARPGGVLSPRAR
jgi:histidinol-phosphate aminotransferase